jgi:hypothetical protein
MISAVDGERGITWSANRSRCRRGQALRFEKFATELDRVGLALSPIDLNERTLAHWVHVFWSVRRSERVSTMSSCSAV